MFAAADIIASAGHRPRQRFTCRLIRQKKKDVSTKSKTGSGTIFQFEAGTEDHLRVQKNAAVDGRADMLGRDMTTKGLDVLRALARTGSRQAVASEMDLFINTVSRHLKTLGNRLGAEDEIADRGDFPFLRYPKSQMISSQIGAFALAAR